MKKYIEPNTFIMSVATQSIVCASGDTGGNPSDARAPQRRMSGLYI